MTLAVFNIQHCIKMSLCALSRPLFCFYFPFNYYSILYLPINCRMCWVGEWAVCPNWLSLFYLPLTPKIIFNPKTGFAFGYYNNISNNVIFSFSYFIFSKYNLWKRKMLKCRQVIITAATVYTHTLYHSGTNTSAQRQYKWILKKREPVSRKKTQKGSRRKWDIHDEKSIVWDDDHAQCTIRTET